jgi:hypothetical protein
MDKRCFSFYLCLLVSLETVRKKISRAASFLNTSRFRLFTKEGREDVEEETEGEGVKAIVPKAIHELRMIDEHHLRMDNAERR